MFKENMEYIYCVIQLFNLDIKSPNEAFKRINRIITNSTILDESV